ncbi:sensor histidine kinase [Dyadobacter luteus]|nr:7TM diverse intracellular signaling domain-containing protein [Dyadobacter luteus]
MKKSSGIFLFLLCVITADAQPALVIDHHKKEFEMMRHIAYFTDTTNNFRIDTIRKIQRRGLFEHNPKTYRNFGIDPSRHWYFFTIRNAFGAKELIMDLPDSYLDHIKVHIFKNGLPYNHFLTNGWRTPINQRPVASYHHAFPISLNSPGIFEVFVNVRRATGTVKGTVLLETKENFYKNYILENHISSLVQGAILLMCLFGFFLFYLTADKLYLWYCLQNISLFLLIGARHGVLNFYLLGTLDMLSGSYANYICALSYGATHLFFVLRFVQVKNLLGLTFYKFILLLISTQLLLLLLIPFGQIARLKYYLMYGCIIATAFTVALIIIKGAARGNRNVNSYALAQTPFLLLILYYMAGIFFPVPVSWITLHGLQFGPLFEVTVLAIALAERFSGFQQQNYILLNNLNEAQTQIIQIQDAERQRIAQDLHDELGGNLAAIKMSLQSSGLIKEKVSPLLKLIDQASVNTRNIAHNLMPPNFEDVLLIDLLTNHFSKLDLDGDIRFHFHATGYQEGKFSKQQELTLHRIVMELVSNIINHSGASEATIQFIGYQKHLEIMVEDDGVGFFKPSQKGIGLKSIRSRVNFLKGHCNIDSNERGTTTVIQVPY